MKTALVTAPGLAPACAEFPTPFAAPGLERIVVSAAAISHVTRARAAGRHYSSAADFPFIAGVDGVGRRDDGSRVYFAMPEAPLGSMAEFTLVPASQLVPIPDALDDATAAAIAIPGASSWVAFTERALLKRGETVLINGASGAAGSLAVKIARHLGAAKVIATGRNAEALTGLGADVILPLGEPDLARRAAPHFAQGVDIVIDYLWGESAEQLLIAAAKASPDQHAVRYVEIGSASGSDITLPSAVLRSTAITLMGSGLGSIPLPRFIARAGEMFAAAPAAGLTLQTRSVPLSDVSTAWAAAETTRTVITMAH
jgi:NADPH:quinone reductase-like Zn-dependent oxidoreductase